MIALPRLHRYIFLQCLSAFAMVMGIFVVAILLVDVVEQLRTVGGDVDLSAVQAVQLSLMKLPMLVEATVPFGLLIAAMIAFSRLNRRSELAVIRASGMSAWLFLSPLIALALAMSLVSVGVLNPLGARLTAAFENQRAELLRQGNAPIAQQPTRDIWLRQGDGTTQIVIHAEEAVRNGTILSDVKILEEERVYRNGQPTDNYRFVRRIDAKRARIVDGFWQLEDLVENVPGRRPISRDYLAIPTELDAGKLLDRFASPDTIGFWTLPRFIQQTSAAGLDAGRYRMRWWGLTATPALCVAMALIGALVCLRLSRLGGTSQLIATGGVAAVGLFFITQVAASLGATGAAPPAVAAWSPALAALFAACTFIAYREDG